MTRKLCNIGPWRRGLQWTGVLLFFILPWLEIDGKSVLRIEFPQLNLYLLGQTLRIQELFFVLLAVLICILFLLVATVSLGRVWCGWFCPQTTLSDFGEWLANRFGLKVKSNSLHGPLWRKALLQVSFLLLAFIAAANFLCYFMPPRLFLARLMELDLHYSAWITLGLTGLILFLDMALVRRLMCRAFCPYGRIQTALVDKGTLSLHLPESELERCIECGACLRSCPMEIDIRHGCQVECINCGRCLDACARVMAKRGEPGLIRYTFGLHGEGAKALLNPRTLLPVTVMAVLLVILSVALTNRSPASLKIAVSHTAPARQLASGETATFFNGWVNNRGEQTKALMIKARNKETQEPLVLKGQLKVELAAGGNQRLDFALLTPGDEKLVVEFVLQDEQGVELSATEAFISGGFAPEL